MPVGQWKPKPKVEDQPPPPTSPPQQQKKKTDADEQSSPKKGRSSQLSKKGDKSAKAAAEAEAEEREDEDRAGEDDDSNQAGRIKNLAGFFAQQKDDPKNVKKKRFEVSDEPETIILENEPERREGVIRSDDPGEWDKPIELEKGWAKNMASMFQSRRPDDASSSRKPFKMDIEEGAETIVIENEPVRLEGVVRSGDKTEDVIGKRGRIKNIAGRFANQQADGGSEGYRRENVEIDTGRTRNIADRWKRQQDEPDSPSGEGGGEGGKPKWMLELESAKEYGVFENEPEVRSDVVHADDEQPDVISAQHTRNLRKMWSQIEKEDPKEREPRRHDIVIRPRKKEPSPEPEPPPPVEEPKPTKRFGGRGNVANRWGKKEKTPPPPEPEPPKQPEPKKGSSRTNRGGAVAAPAPAPEPAPVDPKSPFKTALKHVAKHRY